MDKLVFTMREALTKFQKLWQTLDKDKIYTIIRLCLARELTCVEERKDAAEYGLKRPKSFDSFENNDLSAVKSTSWAMSSPSRAGSPSPKRPLGTYRLDGALKTTVRDANTTGFELKSIGESESRGPRPVGFKEPPALRVGILSRKSADVAKSAPTAENLRRLNTKMSGAKSERSDGGKSVRSGARSGQGDPTDPYKDHSVEQMDTLIA